MKAQSYEYISSRVVQGGVVELPHFNEQKIGTAVMSMQGTVHVQRNYRHRQI